MNFMILIGIVIIVVGFSLKLDVLAVVLTAGIATGLAAKMDILSILEIIGKAFVDNRLMSIFLISLPVIAVLERYGLRERSATLISSLKNATAGKILGLYMIIRSVASALSIRIGGHIQFIRPLIFPMAEAAALHGQEVSQETIDKIRAMAASADNIGNFFGQNIFIAAGGILLIKGVMEQAGITINLAEMILYCIPTAITAYILASIRYILFDKKVKDLIAKDTLSI